MANSPDTLINKTAAHQINLVRYANTQAAEAIPFFEQLIDYINARLAREGESIASKKRLKAVLSDVESKMDQLLGSYSGQIQGLARPIAEQEFEFNAQMIAATVEDYSVVVPTIEKAVTAIYSNPLLIGSGGGAVSFAELTEGWTGPEIKRVAQRISSGFYLGETPTQIARAISGTKRNGYKDGLLEISRRAAQTMAKTAVMDMATQAKTAFNLANDDLIVGEEIVATLDSRTSPYCRGADGKIYLYKDGPFPRPPFHLACRSATSPVLSPEFDFTREVRTRPAVGEGGAQRVDAGTSYYEWLKSQPKAVQDDALGPAKADIFRNAGLTAEEFRKAATVGLNQPLTIDLLRKRNKEIAQYLDKE